MPKKADPTKGLSIRQCEKTGEWIARVAVFTPPDTPQQRFKNMMDAVRYQRKLKENYKRDARMRSGQKGVSISDAKKAVKCPTLEQLVTRFFKDYENDKGRPHTSIDKFITQSQRSKNIAHVKLLRPMLKKPVDQITPKEVSDWFNLFRTTPKSNGKLQTISNCKKQKGWYAEAYRKYKKEYNLEINPFEGKYLYPKKSDGSIVEAWHKGNHHEKTSVFTDEQIEAFREYGREWVCYKTYERPKYVEDEIFFAFEIALATGMRLQEVLRVELDEIDVKGKSLFISASKCKEKRDKIYQHKNSSDYINNDYHTTSYMTIGFW